MGVAEVAQGVAQTPVQLGSALFPCVDAPHRERVSRTRRAALFFALPCCFSKDHGQSARVLTSIARDASSRARSPPAACAAGAEVCRRRPSADEIVSPRPDAVLSQKIASWICSIARCTQGTRGVRPRGAGSRERGTVMRGGPGGSSRCGGVP